MMGITAHSSSRQNTNPRVFLVTGATGAIGKAIARQLAATPDSEVVLVCRDKNKAKQTVKEIVDSTGNSAVRFELADLSRYGDIRRLVERRTGPLHGLINNAAFAHHAPVRKRLRASKCSLPPMYWAISD
jgi:retinol dehydrogenase-13